MPSNLVNFGPRPWLDIGSYGRRGPGRRDRLSSAQVATIARTVRRTPEVMVKMLNQGATSLAAVRRHINYLDRGGELQIETDDGEPLKGKSAATELLDDWDLDMDAERPWVDLKPSWETKKAPKLVHKILFSMPAGTPPKKVLEAVRNFAREEFGAQHRYAMVLHTDEPHPHVHVVVKAMGYAGKRLNIRHATLREWRREFARHLREQGVAANATERVARGVTRPQKTDGIYRAGLRGVSTHWRQRAEAVARELASGEGKNEPGRAQLLATRRAFVRGWDAIANSLERQGEADLARKVRHFVRWLPPARAEREWIREELLGRQEARENLGQSGGLFTRGNELGGSQLADNWRGFGPIRALTRSLAYGDARRAPTIAEDKRRAGRPHSALTAADRLRRRSDAIAAQLAAERERVHSTKQAPSQDLGGWRQVARESDRGKERTRDDRGDRTR